MPLPQAFMSTLIHQIFIEISGPTRSRLLFAITGFLETQSDRRLSEMARSYEEHRHLCPSQQTHSLRLISTGDRLLIRDPYLHLVYKLLKLKKTRTASRYRSQHYPCLRCRPLQNLMPKKPRDLLKAKYLDSLSMRSQRKVPGAILADFARKRKESHVSDNPLTNTFLAPSPTQQT